MKPPDTPLLDRVMRARLDWMAQHPGQPVLAVDPDTYNALSDEGLRRAMWDEVERGQPTPEPRGLTHLAANEVVITLDVDGWEWRRDQ